MNAKAKILLFLDLIRKDVKEITEFSIRKRGFELKIKLNNGIFLYIVYNDHNHYSYTIQYSLLKFDRKRFDNFDDFWEVETRPHHFHVRGSEEVATSPMTGDPRIDFLNLINAI